MKKLFSFPVIIVFLFAGCAATPGFTQQKETRNVDSFTRVGMAVAGELYLSQGNTFKVVLEGPERLLKDITTRVEGNQLKIKYKSWGPHRDKVNVFITMPDIEELSVAGSGNIHNETTLRTEKLLLAVSGSGNITLNQLWAEKVETGISGSGDIRLDGDNKLASLYIAISGSGKVDCLGLKADEVNVKISGSGNANVYATEKLAASIAGSGSVKYKGNPVVNAKVSGSGKVRSVN